jgi:hypothetical protein
MNEKLDKIQYQDAPEEIMIESMLQQYKPQPTARFYRKIQNAPWMTITPNERAGSINSIKPIPRLIWGIVALLLILVIIGISFIPPVRTVARQIFFSFISAPSNQLEIQVTLTNPTDLYHFSDPANFPSSIKAVQQNAGFEVKEIQGLPERLVLVGARYDPSYEAVTILYLADDYKLFLTQRLVGNGEDIFSIGASATVNLVKIGGYQGEFVKGGWKAISTQATRETSIPGSQTNISAIWDGYLPQYTLRWRANGYSYELRTIGEGSPSQSQLITLANELK